VLRNDLAILGAPGAGGANTLEIVPMEKRSAALSRLLVFEIEAALPGFVLLSHRCESGPEAGRRPETRALPEEQKPG
jgi:hypothetical protein